ncbi:unnamed protein product [Phaedon cochleariae]|uniref:Sulfotransferase domain-containing protein n=1 Tax=Phaedon cochleariae TaxID=80249 RepID=A0A9P0DM16_PHACE|nr:unnamed protein product [Phaedon cochleariae]
MMGDTGRKLFEKLPFEIKDIDATKLAEAGIPDAPQYRGVLVGPNKYFLHPSYKEFGLDIYNWEARSDDVYLLGYHRSGTTLHAELIWLIANNLDFEKASIELLDFRFRHIDGQLNNVLLGSEQKMGRADLTSDLKDIAEKYKQQIGEVEGRRFIKCHLPISLNSPHIFDVGSKVIYVARNPKDVIVSMYHICCFFFQDMEKIPFEMFFKAFKSNMIICLPYFEHVKEAWRRRNEKNFLFLFYEDTMKDKRGAITKIAEFLEKPLTAEQVDALEDHLSFEKFKKNKSVNMDHFVDMGIGRKKEAFIRKGQSGGWRDYFSGDLEREVDEWIEENLRGTDLRFRET